MDFLRRKIAAAMPQYDESFILDDSANQRRNKRSYRVSRKGLPPAVSTPSIDGHGTYVLRNNLRNNLGQQQQQQRQSHIVLYPKSINKSFPSLLDDAREDKFIISTKNNNYYDSFASGGKSLEDLASEGHYVSLGGGNNMSLFGRTRGKSLQNLNEHRPPPACAATKTNARHSTGFLLYKSKSKDTSIDADVPRQSGDKRSKRLYESNNATAKLKDRSALRLAARILESGVYRQIGKAKADDNDDSGFAEDFNDLDNVDAAGAAVGNATPLNTGHKASFRGANKLARRARSFKEDLLERISAIRSPGAPANPTLPSLRSQSPLSPKSRNQQKTDDPEMNPTKELEILVRQIQFDLKHFSDVITKKKLEMLPGNGTIVLETITKINNVILPYISPLSDSPSAALDTAQTRLCHAVADLIRLCDESMVLGEDCKALKQSNVARITGEIQDSVKNLTEIAFEQMSGKGNSSAEKPNGAIDKEPKNLKLYIRPSIDGMRNATNDGQRNSLPDIPLTPRERQIVEGSGNNLNSRTSFSTESILDSVSTPNQDPPPKPPIPNKPFDVAPPLPPKRKNDNSIGHLSAVDRVSLQSHSTGSLDSMLNVSNDEEIRAIMDRNSVNLDEVLPNVSIDASSNFPPNSRLSHESNSTVCTSSSASTTGQNRLSNEAVCQQIQLNLIASDNTNNQLTNHNRFSTESGFASMGYTRNDMSVTNASYTSQNQKCNLSYIDSTPTPNDMPSSLLNDLSLDLYSKFPSPTNINICQQQSSTNVIQQSSVKQSNKQHFITSDQFFEQNSKTFSSNESKFFSQSTMSSNNQTAIKSESTSIHTFSKCQKNISQSTIIDDSNMKCNISNMSHLSLNANKINTENEATTDQTDFSIPPALPVKTRKQGKIIRSIDQGFNALDMTIDDQVVELRQNASCALHGHGDGFIQRPHTLMDQSLSSGQPPPLPVKKKHMFQSVAYSVMAYMEMFGNCSHSPQNSSEFMRHSVHEHQHSSSHCLSSIQQFSNASLLNTRSQMLFSQNGQSVHSFNQNNNFSSKMLGFNQQLSQSHTLHQFNTTSGNGSIISQDLSLSPHVSSPRLQFDESAKLEATSLSSVSTNSSLPPNPPSPILSTIPPALPPKRTKIKQTPNHSPAKPPLSPKPIVSVQTDNSPPTPVHLSCTTPLSGRSSISPAPQFQFDPPPVTIDTTMLLNPDDEQWLKQSSNKPGKFPVEDLELERRKSANASPSINDNKQTLDNEAEPDTILEMDVSTKIVWKNSNEEGPDIRGGHPDALIVQAIKSNKDFSYQEAFLITYRTFVTPIELIKKLNRRHIFLTKNGKYTKAREVQSLLTRVVEDLTITDLDDELLNMVLDFTYSLISAGDLAMAKVLRVKIIEKYNNKQLMQQLSAPIYPWAANVSVRRDSILEQKAEAVAEQMTLLDSDLFTRIPAPEALLWARNQCEEQSPNLTRFTEHFNKMSYWARSRILEQEEAKDREKYVNKFMKIMKYLRKMNNFNSLLALLSALDSGPIRRLEWQKQITDGLEEYCTLIDNSSSFRVYRQALADTQPPCIPYLGLVLQDLTFIHIGNPDLLPDGSINFSKRWQQYHILENMKRFSKAQYTFKKNERIIAMFNGFDDILNEEAMWQISESIKPKASKRNNAS